MSRAPGPPRRRPPTFQPRFLAGMIYLVLFFLLYAGIAILPAMLEALGSLPPGPGELRPEEMEAARTVAREAASRTVLAIAFAGSLLTTVIGSYYRVLPGLRADRG